MQPHGKFDTGVDAGRNDAALKSNGSTTGSGMRTTGSDRGACGPPSPSSTEAGLSARALACAVALVLAAMLTFGASPASAQTAVCPDPPGNPGAGERIECTEDATSTDDIDIDVVDFDITTTGDSIRGIYVDHRGAGKIIIKVQGGTINTTGYYAEGVNGEHFSGAGDVIITLIDSTIITSGESAEGVEGAHEGTGNITIDLTNPDITTGGPYAHGVFGHQRGVSSEPNVGNIDIDARGGTITTTGDSSDGIYAYRQDNASDGGIDIDARNITIDVTGDGVSGLDESRGSGDIIITLNNAIITTSDVSAVGVYGANQGTGNITINLTGATIDALGAYALGVYAHQQLGTTSPGDIKNIKITAANTAITSDGTGILGRREALGEGVIDIDVNGGSITTKGLLSHGVRGFHESTGDITIDLKGGVTIITESVDLDPDYDDTFSHGIYGDHRGGFGEMNDIDIDVNGGSITTRGVNSYGIYARNRTAGDITINTSATVITEGAGGHGVYTELDEGEGEISVSVGGGSVTASGMDSSGVKVGYVNASGLPERVADHDDNADGYRRQTVTVNGDVFGGTGDAAGVFLAGGGRVVIGPRGSVGADSGIAILATGATPGFSGEPKLRVDMNPGGRQVAEVIGDDWIINDGGETTIAVNGVVLHEGASGVTGRTARNGAWNVTMRDEGVTVTDRADPDPVNWTITAPAAGVIADRDFSTEDFNEARRPPPPPTCPEGQVGTPPDCMTPQNLVFGGSGDAVAGFLAGGGQVVKQVFGGLVDAAAVFLAGGGQVAGEPAASVIAGRAFSAEVFIEAPDSRNLHEVYAPRAAVYEALPGFLLRLNGGGPEGERLRSPGSPVWAKLSGGRGSYESERASVGAEYDFNRFTAQVGLDVGMGEHFTGSISVRHVTGSAEVSAPTGGGDIEAKGIGVSLGASWKGAGGYYANGSLSLTDYDMELASGDRSVGTLQKDAAARGNSLGIEAGRRIKMNGKMNLTPRAWMTRSEVSIDKFTDSTGAHFSLDDAMRLTGGVGVVAETARTWDGGSFSLRGSLDLEQKIDDVETAVDVSGERLESKSTKTRFLFGLGGVYRKGRFSVSGEVSVGGLGSDDAEYAGRVTLGMRF